MKGLKSILAIVAVSAFLGCASAPRDNISYAKSIKNRGGASSIIKNTSYSSNGRLVMGFDEKARYNKKGATVASDKENGDAVITNSDDVTSIDTKDGESEVAATTNDKKETSSGNKNDGDKAVATTTNKEETGSGSKNNKDEIATTLDDKKETAVDNKDGKGEVATVTNNKEETGVDSKDRESEVAAVASNKEGTVTDNKDGESGVVATTTNNKEVFIDSKNNGNEEVAVASNKEETSIDSNDGKNEMATVTGNEEETGTSSKSGGSGALSATSDITQDVDKNSEDLALNNTAKNNDNNNDKPITQDQNDSDVTVINDNSNNNSVIGGAIAGVKNDIKKGSSIDSGTPIDKKVSDNSEERVESDFLPFGASESGDDSDIAKNGVAPQRVESAIINEDERVLLSSSEEPLVASVTGDEENVESALDSDEVAAGELITEGEAISSSALDIARRNEGDNEDIFAKNDESENGDMVAPPIITDESAIALLNDSDNGEGDAKSGKAQFYDKLDAISDSAAKIMDAVKSLDDRAGGAGATTWSESDTVTQDNNVTVSDTDEFTPYISAGNGGDEVGSEDGGTLGGAADDGILLSDDGGEGDYFMGGEDMAEGDDFDSEALSDDDMELQLAGPLPSRTMDVLKGQLLEASYPGVHWRYLECVNDDGSSNSGVMGFVLLGRKTSDEATTFIMKVAADEGKYLLHFYTADALSGGYLDDYLEVRVESGAGSGYATAPVYSYGDYTITDANIAMAEDNDMAGVTGGVPYYNDGSSGAGGEGVTNSGSESGDLSDGNLPYNSNLGSDNNSEAAIGSNDEVGGERAVIGDTNESPKNSNSAIVSDASEKELLTEAQKMFEEQKWEDCLSAVKKLLLVARDCADEGLFLQGRLLEEAGDGVRDINKAIKSYETLVRKFPMSALYEQARRRIIYLRRFFVDIR